MHNHFLMKYLVFLPMVLMLLWSCGNEGEKEQETVVDTTEVVADTAVVMNEVVYQVPSPDEFFSLLSNKNLKFKAGIIHDDKKQYESRAGKEMNMGVYVADMAYLNTFGEMKTAVKYFVKVRELADQLGLSSAIPESTMKKIEESSSNTDSLRKVSDESFYNVIQSLEEAGNGKSLAMIMTSGWVETMYISLQLTDIKKFDYKAPLIQRICSQKVTFSNIIKNLERFADNPEAAQLLNQVNQMNAFFESLTKEELTVKQDTTQNIIGTPTQWKTDKETFQKFIDQVNTVRKSIVEQS